MCRCGSGSPDAIEVRVRDLVTFFRAGLGIISDLFLDMGTVSAVGGVGAGTLKKNILAWLLVGLQIDFWFRFKFLSSRGTFEILRFNFDLNVQRAFSLHRTFC